MSGERGFHSKTKLFVKEPHTFPALPEWLLKVYSLHVLHRFPIIASCSKSLKGLLNLFAISSFVLLLPFVLIFTCSIKCRHRNKSIWVLFVHNQTPPYLNSHMCIEVKSFGAIGPRYVLTVCFLVLKKTKQTITLFLAIRFD